MHKNFSKGRAHIILLVTALLILLVGSGYYFWNKFSFKTVKDKVVRKLVKKGDEVVDDVPGEPEGPVEASELVSIDDTWNRYTNGVLGFSMNVPVETAHNFGDCEWRETDTDHSYRPGPDFLPVAVFDDNDNNRVFISVEYYYELSGETRENGRSFYSDCDAVDTTLDMLTDETNYRAVGWEIVVENVTSDAELEDFIRDRYGDGCSLGGRTPNAFQEGVYDVSVEGDGLDLGESLCPMNYMTIIRYSPDRNKVIAWDLGQANSFFGSLDYMVAYDQDMVDSFRFE